MHLRRTLQRAGGRTGAGPRTAATLGIIFGHGHAYAFRTALHVVARLGARLPIRLVFAIFRPSDLSEMLAIPPSAPIHSINDDVLLYIFTINADMFADTKALHITRITSQVCFRWRSLILNTPFLWARLIDMDTIHSDASTPEWWNELIQRSGVALLWIRAYSGLLVPTYPHTADRNKKLGNFIFNLMKSNWNRIQRLVIHGNHLNSGLTRAMVSFPAPKLQEFEAPLQDEIRGMHGPDVGIEDRPIVHIFAGTAPLLRIFRGTGYVVNQRVPWVRHLHFIELNCIYSVCDALKVLSAAHSLQEIRINDLKDGNLSKSVRNVSLPHLKRLEYEGFSQPCASLLDHVEIPLGCSLTIHIFHCINTRTEEMRQHLLRVVNIFRHHAEHHLQSHPLNTLYLNYTCCQSILFRGKTTIAVKGLLHISIPLHEDYDSTQISMFLNQIGRLDLSRITKLQFRTRGPLYPYFQSFFSSLRSLEAICADSETLENLTALQNCMFSETIFPCLKTIELAILLLLPIADQIKAAAEFLLLRIKSGHPIAILDMARYSPLNPPPNLNLFEDFENLTMLYKCSETEGVFEYIGGSGYPEIK